MAPALAFVVIAVAVLFILVGKAGAQQFDAQAMGIATDQPQTNGVLQAANAIASAEGFGLPGAVPSLAHNPGDLVIPGWTGAKLGEGISVFSSDAEGWSRLYRELNLIVNGQSGVYSLTDTIATMAAKWTASDPNSWASNVAVYLGVGTDATLAEVLA